MSSSRLVPSALILLLSLVVACGGGDAAQPGAGGGGRPGGGPGGFGGGPAEATAIPVQVVEVARRTVSDYLQTTGALEAEDEVDVVARTSGPIVELRTEEGRSVEKGQVLARIDDRELRADLELARVELNETEAAYQRARRSFEAEIISAESFEVTRARYETAKAQIAAREIQLSYTEIRAPFAGRVIERVIQEGEYVTNGSRLFRISDFDPLLCPIQVPEKDLRKVRIGQTAVIRVESFPGETFEASVLRINPVIDNATGTFKVTLEVRGRDLLRPGMFASVFLEVDRHQDTLVVPKRALVLEGVGDTVYLLEDGVAVRREVELGFEEADSVEILSGIGEGEKVIVLGQDSLTDGTPVYVLDEAGGGAGAGGEGAPGGGAGAPGGAAGPPGSGGRPAVDWNDPEQVERVRERMRSFGMSDEQIDARIEQMKAGGAPAGAAAPRTGPAAAGPGGGPEVDWNDPQQVEEVRERMRARGLGDDEIDQRIERMKSGEGRPPGSRRQGGGSDGSRR